MSIVVASTALSSSWFNSSTVRTKNECLYWSVTLLGISKGFELLDDDLVTILSTTHPGNFFGLICLLFDFLGVISGIFDRMF